MPRSSHVRPSDPEQFCGSTTLSSALPRVGCHNTLGMVDDPEELALCRRQIHTNRSAAPSMDAVLGLDNIATHLGDYCDQRFLTFDRPPLGQRLLTILR